jgi:tryptophan synthase alpha chain
MTNRITQTFKALASLNSTAFVGYMMGGDPDRTHSQKLLNALPEAGVDIIELGMPFTDPAADGPTIEDAGLRSLKSGTTLNTILEMAAEFRKTNATTPLIIMGYCNPVHHMGYSEFSKRAKAAGIDGAIIVDLPPEEDSELRAAFETHNLALIRLATPTTDAARLPKVVAGTKGFVYYVSMTGITGAAFATGDAKNASIKNQVAAVQAASNLPVVVGFGVKTPERATEVAKDADGVVVGSAIVEAFHKDGHDAAIALVKSLADATHKA